MILNFVFFFLNRNEHYVYNFSTNVYALRKYTQKAAHKNWALLMYWNSVAFSQNKNHEMFTKIKNTSAIIDGTGNPLPKYWYIDRNIQDTNSINKHIRL